ncbi:Protein of unknown function (DUF3331) [Paraburkholderia caribensis MBA4]|uniref:DUF3331 domain-containing protein n=1 Tax=Paraburkholderia caribensis MBA4 TaxID=1323664 RepID=A0A0P0RDT3_9BURK|nr:DUF3331 domain-containing protein [Paraburkholderia caribensis]ALL66468.1 Protein of unknown function (DUF3331) [Paraburkholderia caribensis MBA4]
MTSQSDDDIARRVLLGVLMLDPQAPQLTIRARRAPKKKRRLPRQLIKTEFNPAELEAPPSRVSVLEQLSSKSLSVYWSDPRSGHYANQVWRIGVARIDAFCALSGMPICRGDAVYRPRVSPSYLPANHNRMILAAAVPELPTARTLRSESGGLF